MDAELANKAALKYNYELEREVVNFLFEVTGSKISNFHLDIKDGVILCQLINKIQPNIVKPNLKPKHYLEEHGNIMMFLDSAAKLGVPNSDLFTLRDVGELKPDMNQVLQCVAALSRQAQALGCRMPRIGPTYYKSREDQLRIQEKKNGEKEKAELVRKEEEKKGLMRREEIERSKEELRKKKVAAALKSIEYRKSERLRKRQSDKLRKHGSVENLKDLERLENSNILYGLDLEMKLKREATYEAEWKEKETEVLNWIESITGEQVDHIFLHLKSGRVLCKLINIILPNSIKKINEQKIVFYERENIQKFCNTIISLGLPADHVFSVDSLYDAKDLISVVRTLLALKNKATRLQDNNIIDIGSSYSDKANESFSWSKYVVPLVVGVGGGVGATLIIGATAPVGIGVGVIGAALSAGTRYWFGY